MRERTTLSKALPDIYVLNPANMREIDTILILGCGGTGAYTIAFLSRIISTLKNNNINYYIADGDIVEEKNLSRQHFVSQDINRNKAEVLAERYSSAFGISICAIPEELKTISQFNDLFAKSTNILIIGCVDNNASRKIIYDFAFAKYGLHKNVFWIDSGNEETNGQVVLGLYPGTFSYNPYNPFNYGAIKEGVFSLPNVIDLYPEMINAETRFNSDLSCAERAASAPQNMMTNITAATLIVNYAQKIIFKQPIKSHATEFTINNTFTTRLNTPENLKVVSAKRKLDWEKIPALMID